MNDTQTLANLFENALLGMLERRGEAIRYFASQDAFDYMKLSVAHWHPDVYWNLAAKDGQEFDASGYDKDYFSPEEFILLLDYERVPGVAPLLEALEAINEAAEDNDDDDIMPDIRLTHSALALAFKRDSVINKLAELLGDKMPTADNLHQVIHIHDVDGYCEQNFLAPADV
ncbi:hypothetical protein [Bacterioplanoides pacificum]|uniref:DUF4303 domain-containing protein n=1 Tax=Bacterioplanoides pacificum TaxID=1171596 RepID=A0ABV7VRE5_9GAMM